MITGRDAATVAYENGELTDATGKLPRNLVAADVRHGPALMMVRPELIRRCGDAEVFDCSIPAEITEVFTKGGTVQYRARTPQGFELAVEMQGTSDLPMRLGETVRLGWQKKDIWILNPGRLEWKAKSTRSWRDPELLVKALPSVLLQTTCFLAPLLMTFILTFQRTRDFQLRWTWDLTTWTDIFTKPHYWTILSHTLVMAVACVVVCILLAFPIAYGLGDTLQIVPERDQDRSSPSPSSPMRR